MLSNDCWFARHDYCPTEDYCECLCHVGADELLLDAGAT